MDEKKLLLNIMEDKFEKFYDYDMIEYSVFLTMEEQSQLSGFLQRSQGQGVFLFGGYENAERKMVLFLPYYTGITGSDQITDYFCEHEQDCPWAVLKVEIPSQAKGKLTHRDYLGALMGEGIKREKIGDILVSEQGAQVIVAIELADYLVQNYTQVGRLAVNVTRLPISSLNETECKTETLEFTVPSPRLDNIISSTFGLSRKMAVEAIQRGLVFVNDVEMVKPDYSLKGEEKIVLRGKGKAKYHGTTGISKKGRTYVQLERYI